MRSFHAPWLASLVCAAAGFGAGYAGFRTEKRGAPAEVPPPETSRAQSVIAGAAGTPEDRIAALFTADREPDSLRRDAALFHAIERLQAGDLPALLARFGTWPREGRQHVLAALVAHWLEVDEDGALRYFGGPSGLARLNAPETSPEDAAVLRDCLDALARSRPEWVLARAQDFSGADDRFRARHAALRCLAERDPAKARRAFAELPVGEGAGNRGNLRASLLRGLAKSDPASALAMARAEADPQIRAALVGLASGNDPGLMRAAIAEIADPEARRDSMRTAVIDGILAEAEGFEDWLQDEARAASVAGPPERARELERLHWLQRMVVLNERSPEQADAFLETLSGGDRAGATAALFGRRALDDAGGALAWLATQPADMSTAWPENLSALFQNIARESPEEWRRWLAVQPAGALRDHAALAAIPGLAAAGQWAETSESYRRSVALDATGDVGAKLAGTFAEREGPRAAAWVETLPAGVAQVQAAVAVGEKWSLREPTAAALWIEQLPPGALRDGAIAGYAEAVKRADPPVAAASLERIADPRTRQRVAERVFRAWLVESPVAARRWLRSLADLDAAWMERTLKIEP